MTDLTRYPDPPAMVETIEAALRRVLQTLESPHSRRAYAGDWSEWTAWCSERNPVVSVARASPTDLLRFIDDLKRSNAKSTIGRKLSALRCVYAAFVQHGICATNPAREIKGPKMGGDPKTPWLDKDQLTAILTPHGKSVQAKRDQMIMIVLAGLGWRRSEVARLRWAALRTLPTGGMVAELVVKTGKTVSVAVPSVVAVSLAEWHIVAGGVDAGEWVFPNYERSAAHVTPQVVNQVVKRAAIAAGIDPDRVTAHALRRTFATIATLSGTDLRDLQRAMGHSKSSTTEGYIKSAEAMRDAPGDAVFRALDDTPSRPVK